MLRPTLFRPGNIRNAISFRLLSGVKQSNGKEQEKLREESRTLGRQLGDTVKTAKDSAGQVVKDISEVTEDLGHRVAEQGIKAIKMTKEVLAGTTTVSPPPTNSTPNSKISLECHHHLGLKDGEDQGPRKDFNETASKKGSEGSKEEEVGKCAFNQNVEALKGYEGTKETVNNVAKGLNESFNPSISDQLKNETDDIRKRIGSTIQDYQQVAHNVGGMTAEKGRQLVQTAKDTITGKEEKAKVPSTSEEYQEAVKAADKANKPLMESLKGQSKENDKPLEGIEKKKTSKGEEGGEKGLKPEHASITVGGEELKEKGKKLERQDEEINQM